MRPTTSAVNIVAADATRSTRRSADTSSPTGEAVENATPSNAITVSQLGCDQRGQRDAEQPARHGDHRALGRELPRQSPASGAEGHTRRELRPARRAASEQEIGDIDRRDQQHERSTRGQEQGERLAKLSPQTARSLCAFS